MPGSVVVVGSANVDVRLPVATIPRPGETVLAGPGSTAVGGKGANQAVAAARYGVATTFVGAVGDDDGAALVRGALSGAGVDLTCLRTVPGPTGVAYVMVGDDGDNAIVVASGANADPDPLTPDARAAIEAAQVLLLQLEVPNERVREAAALARSAGAQVVLNAAPARSLPTEIWSLVDLLVVNEGEAAELGGSAEALLERVPAVLVTLGGDGAVYLDRTGARVRVPAEKVSVVDTTAAGDTFCGVLGAALAQGAEMADAMRTAGRAAGITVTRVGAIDSIPTRAELG